MSQNTFALELITKTLLTHDVYGLAYRGFNIPQILPGQFLLCDCDSTNPRLRRSYSVSWVDGDMIYFIVKRIPDGKGGSIALCDQNIGHVMQVWGPMGHFILQESNCPKVFIGTGTGFAPLYFMLRKCGEESGKGKVERCGSFFLFGVRELRDVFYQNELEQWSLDFPHFDYEIFCSRESGELPWKHHQGRVTDYLKTSSDIFGSNTFGITHQFLNPDTEFYICGSPAMVAEVRSILSLNNVSKGKIFFEQY